MKALVAYARRAVQRAAQRLAKRISAKLFPASMGDDEAEVWPPRGEG
jgi:hypothetical protein